MATWLVPFQGRNHSATYKQNFLYYEGSTYVMDNHRAALWCWLQHVEPDDRVQLLHIDRHTDTLYSNIDQWVRLCPDIRQSALSYYLELSYHLESYGEVPLFRWDNYLSIFLEKHGKQVSRCYFATHNEGDEPRHPNVQTVPPWDLGGNVSYWIEASPDAFIVNVDLDYFVYPTSDHGVAPFFSSSFFREVFLSIRKQMDAGRIKVLTLCLSPECSGGWSEAEAFCQDACAILGLGFRLPAAA